MFHHPRRSASTGAQRKAHTLLATILVALLAIYLTSSHARPAAAQTGPIVQHDFEDGTLSATRDPSPAPNNTASVDVRVSNPPPMISSLTVDKPVLWPPNHNMELVTLDYSVSDNCDAGLVPTIRISSNQPVNGTGDGDTEPDWEVIDAHHVR